MPPARFSPRPAQCPGIHGEAVASTGHIFFGCTDGPVIFDGKSFAKVDVSAFAGEGGYQRSGNAVGSPESSVILADNKTDKAAADAKELERPTSIALYDAPTGTARTVDLGSPYWFRSLARGPLGEALVLTYDGKLHIIDPDSGEISRSIAAIAPWREKDNWQEPGPILASADGYAIISDAQNQELVIIDLHSGEETARHTLDFAATELAVL